MDVNNVETLLEVIKAGVQSLDEVSDVLTAIDRFQQDPSILDDYLAEFIGTLSRNFFVRSKSDQRSIGSIFYTLSKVCNFKRTKRHLPTDIFLLPQILTQLADWEGFEDWRVLSMLLSWLSIILMSPFRLENDLEIYEETRKLKTYSVLDPLVAAVHAELFDKNLDLFRNQYLRQKVDLFTLNLTLKSILNRKSPLASQQLLDLLTLDNLSLFCLEQAFDSSETHNILVLKILPKLCRLHALQETWDGIEEITTWLLNHMALSFTDARIQLAHSLAKVVQLLATIDAESSHSLVQGIFDELIEELKSTPVDAIDPDRLHTELLFIAELGRLGSLEANFITQFAQDVLPVTTKFQQLRVNKITGHQIRDASNFVCWSLVRKCKVSSAVEAIFFHLLMCSMTDPDLTIRRSASAALQETLGRYGTDLMDDASVMRLIELPPNSLEVCFRDNIPKLMNLLMFNAPHLINSAIDWLIVDNVLRNQDYNIVELSTISVGKLFTLGEKGDIASKVLNSLRTRTDEMTCDQSGALSARYIYLAAELPLFGENKIRRQCISCLPTLATQLKEESNNPSERFKVLAFMKALNATVITETSELQISMSILNTLLRIIRFSSPSESRFEHIKQLFVPMISRLASNGALFESRDIYQKFEQNFTKFVTTNNPICCAGLAYTLPGNFLCSFLSFCPHLNHEGRSQVLNALSNTLPEIVQANGPDILKLLAEFLDDYTVTEQGDVGGLVRKSTADLIEKQLLLFLGAGSSVMNLVCPRLLRLAAEPTDKVKETSLRILSQVYSFKCSDSVTHDENLFRFYSTNKIEFRSDFWQGFMFSAGAIYSTDLRIRISVDSFLRFFDRQSAEERSELLELLLRIVPSLTHVQSWRKSPIHLNRVGCQRRDLIKRATVCANFWRRTLESGLDVRENFSLRAVYARFYNLHLLKTPLLRTAVVKLMPYLAVACASNKGPNHEALKNEIFSRLQMLANRSKKTADDISSLQIICLEGMLTICLAFGEQDKLNTPEVFQQDEKASEKIS
ncbi:LAME_0B01288g1_1 [Lachancea meyersii CBS 8951]|uniref:LAME_0B01288g1_1 n=1 Tax=Lachancea meyersii CBS 8951 TaxID=1266667 RepID=A0A1G4IT42_9SACH|nr:LAME_0B01288g1_1 [Lachancea meyersii CBS 8951]